MSGYFRNFPQITYKFGGETSRNLFQNITSYVDLIDNVKDNQSFFQYYEIQEERPDQLSYKLYGTTEYHWTFFLLNDHIRRSGWPLTNSNLLEKAQVKYPNIAVTTRSSLITGFNPGDTVTGLTSGLTGTILRKNADIGQLIISTTNTGVNGEQLISGDDNIIVHSYGPEYLAAAHYVNGDNVITDFDPFVGPGAQLTEVTNYDLMIEQNDSLKSIKVLKPRSVISIASAFEQALNSGS